MKKTFRFYFGIWAILFVLFNAVVFIVRATVPKGLFEWNASFWIAWEFVIVAFVGNLVCAYFAFQAKNLKKMFLNIPLITISWSALIAMLVLGSGFMLIPNCPAWIVAIVCIIVLAFNAIAVIKAVWAADAVNAVDEKIQAQTSFIKSLTVDTESILSRAKSDAVRAECKKVYEAVRYSDPMSNDALSVIEAKITVKVDELSSAVGADDAEKAKEIADEIVILVGDRNKKCKASK